MVVLHDTQVLLQLIVRLTNEHNIVQLFVIELIIAQHRDDKHRNIAKHGDEFELFRAERSIDFFVHSIDSETECDSEGYFTRQAKTRVQGE